MTPEELFEIWAPATSPWSAWAKPVLFAALAEHPGGPVRADWDGQDLSWAPPATAEVAPTEPTGGYRDAPPPEERRPGTTALIVDLPGGRSAATGIALARIGYRPVPLFNSFPGINGIVDSSQTRGVLETGAAALAAAAVPVDAPPAFLIDSNRCPSVAPAPGDFDNRWVVFQQDFPSGNTLLAWGIRRVVLVRDSLGDASSVARAPLADDLAHVLRRWQEDKVGLGQVLARKDAAVTPLEIARPPRFGQLGYRALVALGLRRNAAGGFGAPVPQPSQSSGYG